MSLIVTVAWLALRELWISFRLLVVVTAFVAAGAVVALAPAAPSETLDRLAAGLAIASGIASAAAAGALASHRRRGVAGWLVSRAVPRGALLNGWLLAMAVPALVAVAMAAALAWLAVAGAPGAPAPIPFGLSVVAAAAGSLAVLVLGLAMGAWLPPLPAALLALAACGAVALVSVAQPPAAAWTPAAGHMALAALSDDGRPVATAIRAAGTSLVLLAVLLVVARALLDRADL